MKPNQISIHRYADDFICIRTEEKDLESVQKQILKTVKPIGLELHPDKTKSVMGEPFQFLGYEICQKDKWIAPPTESVKKCYQKIKNIIKKENYNSEVVAQCNPILRGVYNYYAPFSTKKTWERFNKMEFEIAKLLQRKFNLYWIEGLVKYKDVSIKKHLLVKLGYSTLNFDDTYWLERGYDANINPSTAKLYKKQKSLCPICRGKLQKPWNIHHKKITSIRQKKSDYNNLELVHLHCQLALHKGGALMNNCIQKLKLKLPRIKGRKPIV